MILWVEDEEFLKLYQMPKCVWGPTECFPLASEEEELVCSAPHMIRVSLGASAYADKHERKEGFCDSISL